MLKYLKSRGFNSADELEAKVDDTLQGDELRDWEKLKGSYVCFCFRGFILQISSKYRLKTDMDDTPSLSKQFAIEQAILSVTGLASLAGTTVIAGLMIAAIISGPVGWAAIAAVGTAVAVITAMSAVASIIAARFNKRLVTIYSANKNICN
jgi:hypothetical protein